MTSLGLVRVAVGADERLGQGIRTRLGGAGAGRVK